ncbi:translation initiation factor IF-2-like [Meles meles]|uniref:translation initiation factor IF-2-like n=1 Tax=Meles meles TaxID=9662 RepID=UPI001E69DFA5|nr:translation initiation factor IF-2-like [Meles meles]
MAAPERRGRADKQHAALLRPEYPTDQGGVPRPPGASLASSPSPGGLRGSRVLSRPHGATPRGFLPRRRGRSGSRLRAPAVGGRRGSERGRGRGGRGPGREAHGARAPLARPPGARPLRHICSSGREGGRGGRAVRGCLREGGRREEGGGGRRAGQASEEGEEEGRGGRPCSLLPPPLVPSRPPSQQTPLAAAAPGPGRQLPGGACASGGGGGREPALGRGRGGSEGGGAAKRGYREGGGAGPRLSGARPPRPHPRFQERAGSAGRAEAPAPDSGRRKPGFEAGIRPSLQVPGWSPPEELGRGPAGSSPGFRSAPGLVPGAGTTCVPSLSSAGVLGLSRTLRSRRGAQG